MGRAMTQTMQTRSSISVAAIGLLCIAGCSGVVGETAQSHGGGSSASRPGVVGGGSVGASGVVVAGDACKTLDPGPSYVRRLNRFEYNNTVRDLLGDTTAPATDFPAEESSLGFDNNAQALEASPALTEQ